MVEPASPNEPQAGGTLRADALASRERILATRPSGGWAIPTFISALVARWRAATRTLTWVNCGHPPPLLVDVHSTLTELDSPAHPALGGGDDERSFTAIELELHCGERVILVTDGITQRRTEGGGRFGVDGIRRTIAAIEHPTAAATARAVLQRVTDCWHQPLQDDGND